MCPALLLQIPGILFGLLYGVWPLTLIVAALWRGGRRLVNVSGVWLFWAVGRALFYLMGEQPVSIIYIIPEPYGTVALLGLGSALACLWAVASYRGKGWLWDQANRPAACA